MNLFGLEITGDHARLIVLVLSSIFASLGFVAGRWSKHRDRVHFKREDLVGSTVVTELYGLTQSHDGGWVLHIVTQGSSEAIETVFTNPDLIHHIQRAARKHPGLLQLKDPVAHRMMMDEGKDRITGYDSKANNDFLQGRPTRDDDVLFAFAAYRENGEGRSTLHDEVGRLVQMVVAPRYIAQLANPDFIATLGVQHAGYQPRTRRLHDLAIEWQRLEALPKQERQSATDKIWRITVRTALN